MILKVRSFLFAALGVSLTGSDQSCKASKSSWSSEGIVDGLNEKKPMPALQGSHILHPGEMLKVPPTMGPYKFFLNFTSMWRGVLLKTLTVLCKVISQHPGKFLVVAMANFSSLPFPSGNLIS
jgi:hypothetical protein